MELDKKVYFKDALKKLIHYVEKNYPNYNFSVKRQHLVKWYCELLKVEQPLKKKRDAFIISEYFREGSPIWSGSKAPPGVNKLIKNKLKRTTRKERIIGGATKSDQRKKEYNSYLKSSKWKTFKQSLIKERGNKCERCSGEGLVLDGHHLTYKRFMNELPEDVMLVCRRCHDEIHGKK